MKFSVLMSVYEKEEPAYLREALQSVIQQTYPPTEIILMEDGKLTNELEQVIQEIKQECSYLKTIRIEQNVGLGRSLAKGILETSCDWVARMDTDDMMLHGIRLRKFR